MMNKSATVWILALLVFAADFADAFVVVSRSAVAVRVASSFGNKPASSLLHVLPPDAIGSGSIADAAVSLSSSAVLFHPASNVHGGVVGGVDPNLFRVVQHLAVNSLWSATLCGIGDVLAQKKEEKPSSDENTIEVVNDVDWTRTWRFVATGLGTGVLWSLWYDWSEVFTNDILQQQYSSNFSSQVMGGANNGDEQGLGLVWMLRTLICLLLDQFVGSPVVYGLWSIPVPLLLSGASLAMTGRHVTKKLGPILVENAKVWTLANLVIYNLPLDSRVVVMSVANVIWQMILSQSVSQSLEPPTDDTTATTVVGVATTTTPGGAVAASTTTSSSKGTTAFQQRRQQVLTAAAAADTPER